jgi:hypothetical protein
VEWAKLHAITAAATLIPVVGNETQSWVALERTCGTNPNAAGIGAVHTLIFSEKPPERAVAAELLEFYASPGIGRKVGGVLIRTSIGGLLCREFIPLFASYLAGAATYAFTDID